MSDIRIGIVGANRGMFAAKACAMVGSMRVAAIFDIAEDKSRQAAADIKGCRAFGPAQWEEFMDCGIDAAVIASPIPFHAEQSAACLDRGLHVLSEVTAAMTVEQARKLVHAASRSRGTYMLAENCCYLDEAELFKRMARAGELGELYHAEGGYLHDLRPLWRNPDGSLTWRAGELGVYCTHPLGPILDIMDDRVASVSCQALPIAMIDSEIPGMSNHLMLMRTVGGKSIYLRVDHMSPRPYRCYFHVQGTGGVCEFDLLGLGDSSLRICLNRDEKWEDQAAYRKRHLPDRTDVPENVGELGHGSMEYWMLKAWLAALRNGKPMPIDVHRGLDMTLPGIMAEESLRRRGEVVAVPDSRTW